MNRLILLVLFVGAQAVATPLLGQVVTVEGPLPPEVEAQMIDLVNDPSVLRFSGSARLPTGTTIEGDVAIVAGSLELGGVVAGRVVVINGDAVLLPSSRIDGSLVVVGGVVVGAEEAQLAEGATAYQGPLRYRVADGRIEPVGLGGGGGILSSDLGFGQARISALAGPSYNRVEGLPVRLGGTIRTPGRNPISLDAYGIWRSVSGLRLDGDELGYSFRLTHGVGGRGTAEVGATAYDEIGAIESRGMSDLEASLSSFLFREDLRDYYHRKGWSVFARFYPGRPPIDLTVTFREEDALTATLQNPWTLRDQDAPWRLLPMVAEGTSRSVEAQIRWDSRDDPSFPADGWLVSGSFERQVGGSLRLPDSGPAVGEPIDPPDPPFVASTPLSNYTLAGFDVRRYARIGPTMRLGLRVSGMGSLNGEPLPPQRQITLGGEGSLPGHRRFALDCGARSLARFARTGNGDDLRSIETNYAAYGCDRAILFQAELQGELPISGNPLPDDWEDSELAPVFDLQPAWTLFFDAGQAWESGDLSNGLDRFDSPTRVDVGLGVFVGPVGVYWAVPLNRRDGRDFNFFVRLQRRF